MNTSTCIEDEIRINWQEYPNGMEAFLQACRDGTVKGDEPVNEEHRDCGCAYGHISGLDIKKVWDLIYERRQYFHSQETGYTYLEDEVYPIQPGDDLSSPVVKKIYDLILARKPV